MHNFLEDEKAKVKEIFVNAISLLSDEDSKLPEIGRVLPLLLRGIGVHHSGLLPIVKEVIEILFGEGLIKVSLTMCNLSLFSLLKFVAQTRQKLFYYE